MEFVQYLSQDIYEDDEGQRYFWGEADMIFSGIAVPPWHWHSLPLLFPYTLDLEHRGGERKED